MEEERKIGHPQPHAEVMGKIPITNRSAAEQMEYLGLYDHSFKGKIVLVLGPGRKFAFEKKAAEEGADRVIAVSYSFERFRVSPQEVQETHPKIMSVSALFGALPIAENSVDLICSSYGFPMYAEPGVDTKKQEDTTELERQFSVLFKTLRTGGEAHLYPLQGKEITAARNAAQREGGRILLVIEEMNTHIGASCRLIARRRTDAEVTAP